MFYVIVSIMLWFVLRKKLWPHRNRGSMWRLPTFNFIIVLIVSGSTVYCKNSSLFSKYLSIAAVDAGLWLAFLMWGLFSTSLSGYLFERRSISQFPFQYVSVFLFHAICRLETAGPSWAEPQIRSRILEDLDRAARIVRHYLFRQLKTTDRAGWFWREDRARLISNALYDKQRWLMTPMVDTRTKLLESLTETLVAILSGQWDRLEVSDGLSITRAQTFRSGTQIAKAAFTGLLPIGLFVLARRSGMIEIGSPVADYIAGGLLLWAALSVVMAIDPTLTEKTSAMKDVLSIIPGIGKQGEKK
jgi:hypothetical protein